MINDKEIERQLRIAHTLYENYEYQLSEEILIKIIKISPLNTKANELLAYIKANNGDTKNAHKLLSNACLDSNCSAESQYYLGVSFLNLNKHSEAIKNFKISIAKAGNYFEGLHDLGVAQAKLGLLDDAIVNFEKASQLNDKKSTLFFNLGNVYEKKDENEKALINYNKATNLSPKFAEAWFEKGNLLSKLNKYDDSIKCFNIAINIKNDVSEFFINKGVTLYKLKKYEEALHCYKKAIEIDPNLAKPWNEAGVVLSEMMEYEAAIKNYNKAIEIDENNIESWINKTVALVELKKFTSALETCNIALNIDPKMYEAVLNKGVILSNLNKSDEALIYFDKAIQLNKDDSEVYSNKGEALNLQQKFNEAIINFDISLEINKNNANAHHNRAYANFCQLNFEEAWCDFSWRWSLNTMKSSKLVSNKPEWFGELKGNRLFIWAEQGIGEQIMFSSLFSILRNYPLKILVSLDRKLIPIYKRSFPEFLFYDRATKISEDKYDYQCAIGDLGRNLIKNKVDLAKRVFPYLIIEEQKFNKKNNLKIKKKIICGISWKSYGKNFGFEKSIPIENFQEIFNNKEIKFINLQYEKGNTVPINERRILEKYDIDVNENIKIYENIDYLCNLISECDLVITCSNSTAHLAGALNKHTILMVPKERGRFWYWSGYHKQSVWYPSVEIIIQEEVNDWKLPILELKNYFNKLIKN